MIETKIVPEWPNQAQNREWLNVPYEIGRVAKRPVKIKWRIEEKWIYVWLDSVQILVVNDHMEGVLVGDMQR